jgi:hypothetical protein
MRAFSLLTQLAEPFNCYKHFRMLSYKFHYRDISVKFWDILPLTLSNVPNNRVPKGDNTNVKTVLLCSNICVLYEKNVAGHIEKQNQFYFRNGRIV